jgi:hypothetical protein
MSEHVAAAQSPLEKSRSENALRKLDRMAKALRHQEPDRVPISDFFWAGFLRRWRRELGLTPASMSTAAYSVMKAMTLPAASWPCR